MTRWIVLALLLSGATPLVAQAGDPLAPLPPAPPPSQPKYEGAAPAKTKPAPPDAATSAPTTEVVSDPVHAQLPPREIPKDWRGVFRAIRASDWGSAQAGINALPDGPLKAVAKAELYTAKGSPRVDVGAIQALLAEAPDLPEAPQLQRLAISRGAQSAPALPAARELVFLGSAPRRQRLRGIGGEPAADALRAQLDPLVKADEAVAAESLLVAQGPYLSTEARAEAAQRVAWIYYVLGQDGEARRVADQWRQGAAGDWGGQAAWISGLAAWRMGDCAASLAAFRDAARLVTDRDLNSAALYWSARSAQACRRPREVTPLLQAAARYPDNFYGLLARQTLGMPTRLDPAPRANPSSRAWSRANVVRARLALEAGEPGLAGELLRHQARIGPASEHRDLVAIASEMALYDTQYFLAHNGPAGVTVDPASRFPLARWTPLRGWRIDPALAYAHARQESDFRASIVSPAGAVGLMQVLPGTARDMARLAGASGSSLTDPATNLEVGQSYIEFLRRQPGTAGQLPRIMAAYNAGPLPVSRWAAINDRGDPLLWIESIPYWETRHYVPAVLRNMWVYQGLAGSPQSSLKDLAEHRWPAFPASR